MSNTTSNDEFDIGDQGAQVQPVRDADASIAPDPAADPAQAEWDATPGAEEELTATGDDPAQLPADDDEIPAADLPGYQRQPETQDFDPVEAELGDSGEGDLAPEDL